MYIQQGHHYPALEDNSPIVKVFTHLSDTYCCSTTSVVCLTTNNVLFSTTESTITSADYTFSSSNSVLHGLLLLGRSDGSLVIFPLSPQSLHRDHSPSKTSTFRQRILTKIHQGAITSLSFAPDGLSFITGGEDGHVKLWSRNGDPRSTILSLSFPVQSLCFSPFDPTLFAVADKVYVTVKSLKNSRVTLVRNTKSQSETTFVAHKSHVTVVKFHPILNLLITIGGDHLVNYFDLSGKLLSSASLPSSLPPPSSLCISPCGEYVGVGGFEYIAFLDSCGGLIDVVSGFVTQSRDVTSLGSVDDVFFDCLSSFTWRLIGGGFSGEVVECELLGLRKVGDHCELAMSQSNLIEVSDLFSDKDGKITSQNSKFKYFNVFQNKILTVTRDDVIMIYNYDRQSVSQPTILTSSYFAFSGLLFSFSSLFTCILFPDGLLKVFDLMTSSKSFEVKAFSGASSNTSGKSILTISDSLVAVVDPHDCQSIKVFDLSSRNVKPSIFRHSSPISQVRISPLTSKDHHPAFLPLICFTDSTRSLFAYGLNAQNDVIKLGNRVASFEFHTEFPILAAVVDDDKVVYYPYPNLYLIDDKLINHGFCDLKITNNIISPLITNFNMNGLHLRLCQSNDVIDYVAPPPDDVFSLIQSILQSNWPGCVRLCSLINESYLWASLASICVTQGKLSVAEIAYSNLKLFDRVYFLKKIRSLNSSEARKAELFLFRKRPEKAEKVLLSAGLKFRAIEMHMRIGSWERALELAVSLKSHVDTVLGFRKRYLEQLNMQETSEKFMEFNGKVNIDFTLIEEKVRNEKEKEKEQLN
ncbi:hypothetical protein P9112_003410 [Eukaryota sp. TZLM1-RC]